MTMSPIEIEQKTFRVALRGYAEEEVDAFLDEIVASIREYERELAEARDRIAALEQQLETTSESEDRIKKTLVIAQRTADEVVRDARAEAQQILSEARLDASEIEAEQARRRDRLTDEVTTLQRAVADLRVHIRSLTDRLMAQVEETESTIAKVVPEAYLLAPEEPEVVEESEPEPEFADPGYQDQVSADEDTVDVVVGDDDEEEFESERSGEVYLGSDRRPWERYGD